MQAENQAVELTDVPFTVGPSNYPPVVQAENRVMELDDVPFTDWLASPRDPRISMEFPMDSVMELQSDPWYKNHCGGSGFDNEEWNLNF